MSTKPTMEIDLGRSGHKATIDAEDFDLIKPYAWCWARPVKHHMGTGYAQSSVRVHTGVYTVVLLHRLIAGAVKGQVVTFRDSNGLNCTKHNLLLGKRSDSTKHAKVRRESASGMRNIRFDRGGYHVRILKDGKRYEKRFSALEAAKQWAEQMRRELHGGFVYSESEDHRKTTA